MRKMHGHALLMIKGSLPIPHYAVIGGCAATAIPRATALLRALLRIPTTQSHVPQRYSCWYHSMLHRQINMMVLAPHAFRSGL